jgi:glutathione peroxidase
MKLTSILFMGLFSMLTACFTGKNKAVVASPGIVLGKTLYDLPLSLASLDGKPIDFTQFKGKKILFVNTASKCGYTGQYADLEKLHQTYGDKVVVIGLPCNQFGGQEPGSAEEIGAFCQKNYGVSFLITEKIDVKGENQHPLYAWLTKEELNGLINIEVKWNFNKFLVNENGVLTHYFGSNTKPMDPEIISIINP